jgi:DNA-directed RNA polymerase subunit RPC12/RpoP
MSSIGEKKWLGAVAAVVLVVGLAALAYELAPSRADRGNGRPRSPQQVTLYCPGCTMSFRAAAAGPDAFPVECPRCKVRGAFIAYRCSKCAKTFGWDPRSAPRDRFEPVRCPTCGAEAESIAELVMNGALAPGDVPGLEP